MADTTANRFFRKRHHISLHWDATVETGSSDTSSGLTPSSMTAWNGELCMVPLYRLLHPNAWVDQRQQNIGYQCPQHCEYPQEDKYGAGQEHIL